MTRARRSVRVAAFVLGAAALGSCSELATAPVFPLDAPPTAMLLSYGGYGFGSHDVTSRGDTLIVTRRPDFSNDGPTVTRVVPSPAAWNDFWRAADAAGVRSWPSACRNDAVADGGGFSLDLTYAGGRIRSTGSNSYPLRTGRCNRDPEHSPEFAAFLTAVSRLIGRRYP